MKELLNSIKDSARERIKNPLFGAFVLYWCAYNWEVLLRVYSIDKNPDAVINVLKPLLGDPKHFLLPLFYSLVSVGLFPWITVGIQRMRSKPLILSKQDKFNIELKLLESKEKIITQEAKNEGLKTKISKEMELSLKKREFDLDQNLKQSDLNSKLEEVERTQSQNVEERKELERNHQTLLSKQKKIEEDERKNKEEREKLSKANQVFEGEQKTLNEDKLDHVKKVQNFTEKQKKLGETESAIEVTARLGRTGEWDGKKK